MEFPFGITEMTLMEQKFVPFLADSRNGDPPPCAPSYMSDRSNSSLQNLLFFFILTDTH